MPYPEREKKNHNKTSSSIRYVCRVQDGQEIKHSYSSVYRPEHASSSGYVSMDCIYKFCRTVQAWEFFIALGSGFLTCKMKIFVLSA